MTAVGAGALIEVLFIVLAVAVIVARIEHDQYPRGLRWMDKLWDFMTDNLRHMLLRVFYPERLPKKVTPSEAQLAKLEALDEAYREGCTEWNGSTWTYPAGSTPVTYGDGYDAKSHANLIP